MIDPGLVQLIGLTITAITSTVSMIQSWKAKAKIDTVGTTVGAVHNLVNSQTAALLKVTGEASHAEGVLEGTSAAEAKAAATKAAFDAGKAAGGTTRISGIVLLMVLGLAVLHFVH
jgi:hypothetical protein